ncbi:glycosyl hydrolase family 18 protein [Paenibacillaceae bacterium WGS1546]|uniref:glycosyl hydrolase family 18 protein n=1 Tax=Cohnella sp. WGS1546 TaxID=3366810 RepID=UPI00372D4289
MLHRQTYTRLSKMTVLILSFLLIVPAGLPFLFAARASAADITAPANLKVEGFTHNSVTLSWDLVDGISSDDGYNVWNAKTGDWKAWVGGPPIEIGGLSPETEYAYYVTPGMYSDLKSNIVTVTTSPDDPSHYPEPPLAPPHNLRITDITESAVTLGWEGSPGANGYDVYVNGGWKGGVWDGSNRYTFPISEATVTGAVYSFNVAAQNLPKTSDPSNTVTLTWGQLEAPQDVQVVTATQSTVSLAWAPTPGATAYEIYRDGVLIGSSDSNRYVATGLTKGQAYDFKAVAVNRLWRSPDSASVAVVPGSGYNIVTYYTSWSVYERNFMPEDLDVSQITHINYAFSDLCWKGFGASGRACQNPDIPLQADYVFDGEMILGDTEVDIRNMAALNARKADNPELLLIVSVGGWSWSDNFSNMAMTEQTRRAFANSAVDYLREYGLDGLDIDWEYPVAGGEDDNSRSPEDADNFVLLVRTVREALDAAGAEDGKYYLLTIASAQSDDFVVNAKLDRSSAYLDFINIMTYDYSGSWEPLAHHNAPLYYDRNHPKASGPRLNVAGGVLGHLNGGVPNYKLVLGLPFYGKGWLGCPSPGQYQVCEGETLPPGEKFGTWEAFTFDYTDLEENYVNRNGYTRYWNEAAKVPYLYNADKKRFMTYDDDESMLFKSALVKTLDLAGVMSWDISGDRNRTLSTRLVRALPIDGSSASGDLAAPASLKVASVGSSYANLTWDASPGATGYDVFANRAWIGHTPNAQYRIANLAPKTAYDIQVIAVTKEDGRTVAVSPGSSVRATTASPSSGSGGGGSGGSGGASVEPDTSGIGDPSANRLKATTKTEGDKATVTLDTDEAVRSIEASSSAKSQIVVVTDAKTAETIVDAAVLRAIGAKGEDGLLSLVVNGVEFSIPIRALKLADDVANVRITIGTPDQAVIDALNAAAKAIGAQVLAAPVEFRIDAVAADGRATPIDDFGSIYVSRFIPLGADSGVVPERATGVVYVPGSRTIRHVPTLFAEHSDGSVTAELKRTGNSVYAVIQSKPRFFDWNLAWAKDDIEQAAAKGIAFGDTSSVFGSNRNITRGELASILANGLGLLPPKELAPFKDVGTNTKYAGEIAALWKAGIVKGRSADAFDPEGLLTRQELATLLEQAMAYAGVRNEADSGKLAPFADRADVAPFAQASMALMVERKILNGVSPTKLAPLGTVTKAQATVSAMRMLRALKLTD